jgi:predicted PurR-regulated permease PerM
MSETTRPRRLIAWGIGVALLCLVGLDLLWEIRNVLLVIYVSVVLAIGFSPAVRWLERRRITSGKFIPRWAAILILYVTVLGSTIVLLALVIPPVIAQGQELFQQMPTYFEQAQNGLRRAHVWNRTIKWTELLQTFESSDMAGSAVKNVVGALQGVFGVIGTLLTLLLLPYYLLVEADDLSRELLRMLPMKHRARALRVARDVTTKVGAWLTGQIFLSLLITTTTTIALWLMGVPYFYVLGIVAGLGEFVPVIGPLVAALPAVFMGWTVSLHTAIFVTIYFSVQQLIEGNVLVPRIMERQVGLHAVVVVVALLIGTELLGVVGALLAVPTAAIVLVLLQEFLTPEHHAHTAGAKADDPDAA